MSLALAVASLSMGAAMLYERFTWRALQQAKIGLPDSVPSISASSLWLSVPWALGTAFLALASWDPTQRRWLRIVLLVVLGCEMLAIFWLGVAYGLYR